MFEDPYGFGWLLHATAVTTGGAVALLVGRRIKHALSGQARDKRRQLSQLQRLADSGSLTVDDVHQRLVGRTSGWTTEVKRVRLPLRPGAVPSDVWRVALVVDAPPSKALRPLPSPPPGLPAARIEGELLVAHLQTSAPPKVFARLLNWLGELASELHPAPSAQPRALDSVSQACAQLGLTADPALPRWEGLWRGRRLLVEALSHAPLVQVHLELQVQLPGRLWVGGREGAGVAGASGAPVPLPLIPDSGRLVASATTEHLDACRELLANPPLIAKLARHLGDARGSRMGSGEAIIVRPSTVWSVAPDRVVEAALDAAEAMERAVEQPWLAMCAALPLAPVEERQGGLPVLEGSAGGFTLKVARGASGDGVELSARAPEGALVKGLLICARAKDEPAGLRTGDPILDQHIRITTPRGSCLPPEALARLPADALLPLMLGGPSARIDTHGVKIRLPGSPPTTQVIEAAKDMLRLLPALPRTR